MKCPFCSEELSSSSVRFCSNCGNKIPSTGTVPSTSTKGSPQSATQTSQLKGFRPPEPDHSEGKKYTPPQPPEPEFDIGRTTREIKDHVVRGIDDVKKRYNTDYMIPNQLTPDVIYPCEDEIPIKQYQFMKMSLPIAGYRSTGVLQVTNKRVIYNARGASIVGQEYTHSEISVDDVAGISVEKNASLNIFVILAFLLMGIPLTLIGFSIGIWGIASPIISILLSAAAAVGTCVLLKTRHYVYLHILASIGSSICMAGAVGMMISSIADFYSSNDSGIFAMVILGLLWLFLGGMNIASYVLNLFKNNISVVITSKTGAATPINCSSEKGLFGKLCLLKPLVYVYETEETPVMEAELGAMISDIQKLGDYSLKKWGVSK